MSIFYLDKMTWEDVDRLDRQKSIFFLSLSPIEEHGPHLPLGMDFYGAKDMLELALQKVEVQEPVLNYVLVPGIPIGYTEATMEFPGTLSVQMKTLSGVVEDICSSIARHDFRYIIISNHHLDLGHVKAIQAAIHKVMKRYPIRVYEPTASHIYSEEGLQAPAVDGVDMKKEIHADARETSFIRYRYPELLRECYRDLPPVYVNIEESFRKGIKTFRRMGAEKGYIGTPAQATAEYGRQHLEGGASIIADSALRLYRGEKLPEISKRMHFVMNFFVH